MKRTDTGWHRHVFRLEVHTTQTEEDKTVSQTKLSIQHRKFVRNTNNNQTKSVKCPEHKQQTRYRKQIFAIYSKPLRKWRFLQDHSTAGEKSPCGGRTSENMKNTCCTKNSLITDKGNSYSCNNTNRSRLVLSMLNL